MLATEFLVHKVQKWQSRTAQLCPVSSFPFPLLSASIESGERRAPSARSRSTCFPLLSDGLVGAGEGGEAGSARVLYS